MKRKNRHRGFTAIEGMIVFLIAVVVFGVGCWGVNLYKLLRCDFASPYRGEVIHAVGVFVPPASLVTVWFDDK